MNEKENNGPGTLKPTLSESQPPKHLKLMTIMFNINTGELDISGPIEDKVLCYGMLTSAMDLVKDFNDKRIRDKLAVEAGS